MRVGELIAILQQVPQDIAVAVHANNHTAIGTEGMRVALMATYDGPRIVIGNLSRRHLNGPNEQVTCELDGMGRLPDNWR